MIAGVIGHGRYDALPQCGEYCEECGDCLRCSEDACYRSGEPNDEHAYVVYSDAAEGWLGKHPEAVKVGDS